MIWVYGAMVTLTWFYLDRDDEREGFWVEAGMFIILALAWPMVLGAMLASLSAQAKVNNKKKDAEESGGEQ